MWRQKSGEDDRAGTPAPELSDVVRTFDDRYAEILMPLDSRVAIQRVVHTVPETTGLDIAWVGTPDGANQIVLGDTVNTETDLINGLTVPAGAGVGGRVLRAQRPFWVEDYCADRTITAHFKPEVAAEHIKAMLAVPITHEGRLLGVLYAANRTRLPVGDQVILALEHIAARTATAQVIAERARHAVDVAVHNERRRLAVELHDTVGAMLYTIGAGIRSLDEHIEFDEKFDNEASERLHILDRRTAEATAALRNAFRVLSTPPERVALGVALREHCRAFQQRTRLAARVITLTEIPTLPESHVTALSAAVREALVNVEKHARARSVVVSVFAQSKGVTVAVADDGLGLPGGSPAPGLGLSSITDRLTRIGGDVTLHRNDDGGLTLRAWAPA